MQSYIGVEDNFLLENGYLAARLEEIVLAADGVRRFSEDNINEIFRIMHTIKSSAGIMMVDNISILAHKLEDVFYCLRETYPESVPHDELVEGILKTADFITAELVKIQSGAEAPGDAADIISFLDSFLTRIKEDIRREGEEPLPENRYTVPGQFYVAPKADEVKKYYRIDIYYRIGTEMSNIRAYTAVYALKDVAEEMIHTPEDIDTDHETAGIIMREGFHIQLQTKCTKEELQTLVDDSSGVKDVTIQDSSVEEFLLGFPDQETDPNALVIRLDDDWKNEKEADELVPGAYVIQKSAGKGKILKGNHSRLASSKDMVSIPMEKLDALSGLIGDLKAHREDTAEMKELIQVIQDAVLSMQKVSMKGIFHKMYRAVYDISRKLNKVVELETIGENTEIDRNTAALLSDALTHILRNAVDHGIESKRERLDQGKTAKGNIVLEAGFQRNDVCIMISDDGRGLDAGRIFEVAAERGLVAGKKKQDFSEKDIYQFIMSPGFSTKRQITEYSGRGVGLDVVTRNLQALDGSVEVDSVPGEGTVIILRIPQRQIAGAAEKM